MGWFYENFKDNLIIDRHNPIFYGPLFLGKNGKETKKMTDLRDNDSEDALTWNVFSALKNLDPNFWLRMLLKLAFGNREEFNSLNFDDSEIIFWGKISPPQARLNWMWSHPELLKQDKKEQITERIQKHQPLEGISEPDVQIIKNRNFLIVIEAKYLDHLAPDTTYDPKRDQAIRLIDVGSNKAIEEIGLAIKDFYFILLTPRRVMRKSNPAESINQVENYWGKVQDYIGKTDKIKEMLPYRAELKEEDFMKLTQNIGWIHWEDIADFLGETKRTNQFNSFEQYIIKQLLDYMQVKGLH